MSKVLKFWKLPSPDYSKIQKIVSIPQGKEYESWLGIWKSIYKAKGDRGEAIALEYLISSGYTIPGDQLVCPQSRDRHHRQRSRYPHFHRSQTHQPHRPRSSRHPPQATTHRLSCSPIPGTHRPQLGHSFDIITINYYSPKISTWSILRMLFPRTIGIETI